MGLTRKQKATIRAHWPHYELRFKADGTVMARVGPGHPYGVLYTPPMTQGHLDTLPDQEKRDV